MVLRTREEREQVGGRASSRANRQADGQAGRHRQVDGQAGSRADRQADGQVGRQADRQTGAGLEL